MALKTFIQDTRTGELTDVASPEGHEMLLKDLQQARAYSYEATLGDYSMTSIMHAQDQIGAAEQALIDAGYEVPTW